VSFATALLLMLSCVTFIGSLCCSFGAGAYIFYFLFYYFTQSQ